jgi:lipoprotein-anchoring transpeptidase ErfK/SrfK
VLVVIDKSTQEMKVVVGDVERHAWEVSTGLTGYDTPSGSYTARSMNEIWYSKEWDDAPMPHAIFFTKEGHAIHGTAEIKKLGIPASHGCVRLAPENARTLYALVQEHGRSYGSHCDGLGGPSSAGTNETWTESAAMLDASE